MLKERPTMLILSIVLGLDVLAGYLLWMIREQVLADRRLYVMILIGVLMSQLFVSNRLVAGALVAGLMFSGVI